MQTLPELMCNPALEPLLTALEALNADVTIREKAARVEAIAEEVRSVKSALSEAQPIEQSATNAVAEATRRLVKAETRAAMGQVVDVSAARAAVADAESAIVSDRTRREALVELKEEKLTELMDANRELMEALSPYRSDVGTIARDLAQKASDLFSIAKAASSAVEVYGDVRPLELPNSDAGRSVALSEEAAMAISTAASAWRIFQRG